MPEQKQCCGTCRNKHFNWGIYPNNTWTCDCEASEYYALDVEYAHTCEEWEEK